MAKSRHPWLVAVALVVFGVAGCSKDNDVNLDEQAFDEVLNLGIDCTDEPPSFCGAGLCIAGVCRETCGTDAECKDSICLTPEAGEFGGCRLPAESICNAMLGCEDFDLSCGHDNSCRVACSDEAPCGRNDQICVDGACYGALEGDDKPWLECVSGQVRCSGDAGRLEVCNEGGVGWVLIDECGEPGLCDLENKICAEAVCDPEGNRCEDGVMTYCSPGGAVLLPDQNCGSQALCEQGLAVGSCAEPVCTEADNRCAGAVMKLCKEDLTGFEDDRTCLNEAACAEGLSERRCQGEVCDPGEIFCIGPELRRCSANGVTSDLLDTCDTEGLCKQSSTATCIQATCQPGEVRCRETRLFTCDPNIGRFALQEDCGAQGMYCDPVLEACAQPDLTPMVEMPEGYFIDAYEVSGYQYAQFVTTRGTPSYVDLGSYVAISYTDTRAYGQSAECSWNEDYVTSYIRADQTLGTDKDAAQAGAKQADWCDAVAYCKWAGKRLCGAVGGGATAFADYASASADQWTNACVGGAAGSAYSYGNSYDGDACWDPETSLMTGLTEFPACESPDSAYAGVFNLSGGRPEWTDSCDGANGENDLCRARGASYIDTNLDFSLRSQCVGNEGDVLPRSELASFRCCREGS